MKLAGKAVFGSAEISSLELPVSELYSAASIRGYTVCLIAYFL